MSFQFSQQTGLQSDDGLEAVEIAFALEVDAVVDFNDDDGVDQKNIPHALALD